MIQELGEGRTKEILSEFSCPLNKDVEFFLHCKAIEFARQGIAQTQLVATIHLYPGAYAQRHGEIEEYRASRQANIACRDAIDAAIREHFRDNVLSKKAVQSVIGHYGFDRTDTTT